MLRVHRVALDFFMVQNDFANDEGRLLLDGEETINILSWTINDEELASELMNNERIGEYFCEVVEDFFNKTLPNLNIIEFFLVNIENGDLVFELNPSLEAQPLPLATKVTLSTINECGQLYLRVDGTLLGDEVHATIREDLLPTYSQNVFVENENEVYLSDFEFELTDFNIEMKYKAKSRLKLSYLFESDWIIDRKPFHIKGEISVLGNEFSLEINRIQLSKRDHYVWEREVMFKKFLEFYCVKAIPDFYKGNAYQVPENIEFDTVPQP